MRLDLIDEFRLDLHPYVAGECTQRPTHKTSGNQASAIEAAKPAQPRSAPSGSHCLAGGRAVLSPRL